MRIPLGGDNGTCVEVHITWMSKVDRSVGDPVRCRHSPIQSGSRFIAQQGYIGHDPSVKYP